MPSLVASMLGHSLRWRQPEGVLIGTYPVPSLTRSDAITTTKSCHDFESRLDSYLIHPTFDMSDPLDLLRASISENRPAVLLSDGGAPADSITTAASLSFPQASGDAITIPKDAATRYARTDAREDFYNVGQLWLAWTEREAGVRDYLQKGQAAGVGYVAITDRRGVIDFLQGVTDGGVRVLGAGEDGKQPLSYSS